MARSSTQEADVACTPAIVESVPEISNWLKTGGSMFNHFKNDANASITLIDSSGREFLTRLRTSDFQYLIKQTILANVKAQLEKSKSIFHRDPNTDAELAASRLPANASPWLSSKSSRGRIALEDNDDSQPASEASSSSSSGSTYNLAAKLKLFEKKSDGPSTSYSRELHGASNSSFKGSLNGPGNKSNSGKTTDSSNGKKPRNYTGKRRIQPMPTFHHTSTVPFKLQCDEVLTLDEEVSSLPSQQGSGTLVGSAASSFGEVSIRVTKTTPIIIPQNVPKPIKKRRIANKNPLAGMKAAEERMPPKLKLRKSRGRGNRCRKMYGITRRDLWCKSCQWKKRCSRFDEDGNVLEEQYQSPGLTTGSSHTLDGNFVG